MRGRLGIAPSRSTWPCEDSYKRLLGPSMETEIRAELKRRADEEAIRVFAANLRELLLAPPLGQKNVLALDPGFRTGCKVVCLDRQGKLIHNETIYPHTGEPQARARRAGRSATCASGSGSRSSRSATAPPAARPRLSSASWTCRRMCRW